MGHPPPLGPAGKDPTPDQVAAHLHLLHAIQTLRNRISTTQSLFGLRDDYVPRDADNADLVALRAQVAEKRWAVYVARAVRRFGRWWAALSRRAGARPVMYHDFVAGTPNMISKSAAAAAPVVALGRAELPPLDVLMVWHAFMLNPRCYLEDCVLGGLLGLWHQGMPWAAVAASIDGDEGTYDAGEEAATNWKALTGCEWDPARDPEFTTVVCPRCALANYLPGFNQACPPTEPPANAEYYTWKVHWTTCHTHLDKNRALLEELVSTDPARARSLVTGILKGGAGFADVSFSIECSKCRRLMGHDSLRAGKFLIDALPLLAPARRAQFECNTGTFRPMRGTVLDSHGRPKLDDLTNAVPMFTPDSRQFPNLLLMAMARTSSSGSGRYGDLLSIAPYSTLSMDSIRRALEAGLKDRLVMLDVLGDKRRRVTREQRMSLRRMMARYWETSEPFALDLVGAVIRQGSFVEKMCSIDWVHSPTVTATSARLLVKYKRFFDLIVRYPGDVAVPTLDVDLGWHTHQLSPAEYFAYSMRRTEKLIDHDDKIAEAKLSDAFTKTSKRYQELFKEPYSDCTCWYCEAIRAEHTSSLSVMFGRTDGIQEQLHNTRDDPVNGPHISTHNVIKPTRAPESYDIQMTRIESRLLSAYHKACKRARKSGRPEPARPPVLEYVEHQRTTGKRSQDGPYPFFLPFAAYPIFVPPAPYMCAPGITPGVYPVAPGCANMAAGSYGQCCAGTCGGTVAAGACAVGAAAGGSGTFGSCGAAMGACGGGGGSGGAGCAGGGGSACGGGGGGGGGCGGGGGGG